MARRPAGGQGRHRLGDDELALPFIMAMEDLGDPDEIVARADVILQEVARQGLHPFRQAIFGDIFPGDLKGHGQVEDRGLKLRVGLGKGDGISGRAASQVKEMAYGLQIQFGCDGGGQVPGNGVHAPDKGLNFGLVPFGAGVHPLFRVHLRRVAHQDGLFEVVPTPSPGVVHVLDNGPPVVFPALHQVAGSQLAILKIVHAFEPGGPGPPGRSRRCRQPGYPP